MRRLLTARPVGLVAAALALLGAAPAPKPSAQPAKPSVLNTARPPADPAAYEVALERLRSLPPEQVFGFAAFDHQLPVENLGRQTQPGSIRMASLALKIRPEVVYENYKVAFSQQYLPLFTGRMGPNAAYVSFRDPQDGFLRTVTVSGEGKEALVLVAITDPERVLNRPESAKDHAPADWPMPPVLGSPADLESEELGTVQRTRAVSVACTDSGDPISFFETHLPEKGWSPEPGTRSIGRESSQERFRRGEEYCHVVSSYRLGRPCSLTLICTARK